ncbi:DUF3099 domain-containing protein [Nesterenkonia natronophila]|uniref:DUF3099 domain-containing protein n=1 Tax=Nesterenkonia natronophila TaxID=2174932 RepID=A0A3A4F413_9MICC|nr:DUF3099 domain-containing protein [Nesterenkonia natronophila]RJN31220.1 DUF3099 domain-containing protein [Nesterenkonia natronophila]
MTNPVHSITDAPLKHSVEQRARMVRYTVAMSIRIVCFILAAVVGVAWQSWWSIAFVVAAVVLPYIAVVDANAGGDRYMAQREAAGLERQNILSTGSEEPDEEPLQWWEDEDDDSAPLPSSGEPEVIPGQLDNLDSEQEEPR